jgi:hypothetical protein
MPLPTTLDAVLTLVCSRRFYEPTVLLAVDSRCAALALATGKLAEPFLELNELSTRCAALDDVGRWCGVICSVVIAVGLDSLIICSQGAYELVLRRNQMHVLYVVHNDVMHRIPSQVRFSYLFHQLLRYILVLLME